MSERMSRIPREDRMRPDGTDAATLYAAPDSAGRDAALPGPAQGGTGTTPGDTRRLDRFR